MLEFTVGAAFIVLMIYLYRRKQPTLKLPVVEVAQHVSPPVMPSPAQPHVIERIIERQVVVERCPHCDQLSPIDSGSCQNCGAPR